MKILSFIFDWSGVISDDREPVYEANMKILKDHNKSVMSFEEWLPRTTMTPVEFLVNHGVYGAPENLFSLYKQYLDKTIGSGIVPRVYQDVHDVFRHLKRREKKISILSSHPADNLRREAKHYNLTSFLDLISGNSKNKTEGLLNICKQVDEKPESTLYIGDTVYDIRAAKEAGVCSAGICTGYHTKERLESEKPEFLLESLSDLKGFE